MVVHKNYLKAVRCQLDDLRRRLGVHSGDELEFVLVAVEALAEAMAGMTNHAATLIAEGERSAGMIVSAAMTGRALWRMYALPAAVGALSASLVMCWADASANRTYAAQGEADRASLQAHIDVFAHQYDDDRKLLQQQLVTERASLDAERARIEGELPGLLLKQANQLTGVARDLVQLEAANRGFLYFLARSGLAAKHIADANNGSLCPSTGYVGNVLMCEYAKQ